MTYLEAAEYELALEDFDFLVNSSPGNANYLFRRAEAHEGPATSRKRFRISRISWNSCPRVEDADYARGAHHGAEWHATLTEGSTGGTAVRVTPLSSRIDYLLKTKS